MRRRMLVGVVAVVGCGGTQAPPRAAPPPDEASRPDPLAELRAQVAAAADDGEKLILLGRLVAAEWAASCALPRDGLCVRSVARASTAPTCDDHTRELRVEPRDAAQVAELVAQIGELRQLWGGGAALREVVERDAASEPFYQNLAMAEAVAGGLLILGHLEVEAMLAVARPTGLDGGTSRRSVERRSAWVIEVRVHADEAIDRYARITADAELRRWAPDAAVEAAARSAEVSDLVALRLRGLELPDGLRPDQAGALCAALGEQAAPFEAAAVDAWAACGALVDELGVVGDWADRCLARLPDER